MWKRSNFLISQINGQINSQVTFDSYSVTGFYTQRINICIYNYLNSLIIQYI